MQMFCTKKGLKICVIGLLCLLILLSSLLAQGQQYVRFNSASDTSETLQILAVDQMAFNTENGTFEAIGKSEIIYGGLVVLSDQSEARFKTDPEGNRAVESFTSSGTVYFSIKDIEGQSDFMAADLVNERYLFEGSNVQILTGSSRILSNKSAFIDMKAGALEVIAANVRGAAIIRPPNTIIADTIVIDFEPSPDGKGLGELKKLHAIGNVAGDLDGTQISADQFVTGADSVEIELYGSVTVAQEDTILSGDCMKYNTETGSTVLFSCNPQAVTRTRVTGQLSLSQ